MTTPTPGWYADPADASRLRWWDGGTWSDHTRAAEPATAGVSAEPATSYGASSYAATSYAASAPEPSYGATAYGSSPYGTGAPTASATTTFQEPAAPSTRSTGERPRLRGTLIETVVLDAEPRQEPRAAHAATETPTAPPAGAAPSSPPPTSPPPGHAPASPGALALRAPAETTPTAPPVTAAPSVETAGSAVDLLGGSPLDLALIGTGGSAATVPVGAPAAAAAPAALRGPWNDLPLVAPERPAIAAPITSAATTTAAAGAAATTTASRTVRPRARAEAETAAQAAYSTPQLQLAAPPSPRTGASVFVALLPMISILLGTFAGVAGWAIDPVLWVGIPGVTVIVAVLVLVLGHGDRRALVRRGFGRPSFSWLILSVAGYLVIRGMIVRRRSRGGFRPLLVMFAATAIALGAATALVWASVGLEPSPNTTALLEELGAFIASLQLSF